MNNDDEYFPVYVCIMLTIVSNSDSFNSVFPEKRKSINLAKTRKADDVAVRERTKVVPYTVKY